MEPKINYQLKLEQILQGLEGTPRLLLHSCCAPCSSYVLEYLSRYFQIMLFYYNPNIDPPAEYARRLAEQERLIAALPAEHPVTLIPGEYDPVVYAEAVRGVEDTPEGGERCRRCIAQRMEEAAKLCRAEGCDWFTTTLSITPHKDAKRINAIGQELEAEFGVKHLPSDFKKHNGYLRSLQLSEEYGLYRQDYCGCEFSARARQAPQTHTGPHRG